MKKKTTFKILRVAGIVIGAVIVILVAAVIYVNRNAEDLAAQLLEEQYQSLGISNVYRIEYGKIKLGLFSGDLIIKDLRIKPWPSFFESDDSLRLAYPIVFDVSIPRLAITGIDQNFSLQLDDIELDRIQITRPEIRLIDHLTKAEKQQAREASNKEKQDTASGKKSIQQFKLEKFLLHDGSFTFYDRKQDREIFTAGKINVDIDQIELEPGRIVKALMTKTFDKARISIADVEYPLENGFYKISLGEVVNNSGDKSIELRDFKLTPSYDKFDFGKKWGKQTDRMELKLHRLLIEGLDTEKLLEQNALYIDRILVEKLYLNAFRNKNIPFDYTRYPDYPQQALAGLGMDVDIRKLEIKRSEVLYEEVAEGGHKPGKVPIKDIYGTITNVSNIPEMIQNEGPMRWDLQGKFFDEGLLTLTVNFTTDIQSPEFTFHGKMGDMDMKAFNSITEDAAHVHIDDGHIDSLTFEAHAGKDYSEGTIVMKYGLLNITPLGKTSTDESDEKSLLGAVANMVIQKNNPPPNSNKDPQSASIFYERDVHRSIFNYLAKSLVSGIKHTILPNIGSPKKKYERDQRKEERRQQRQERREQRRQQSEN